MKNAASGMGWAGKALKTALSAKGVSKWRLAQEIGVSYRAVQYWADGRSYPSKKNINRLEAFFGKPTEVERLSTIEARLDRFEAWLKKTENRCEHIEAWIRNTTGAS